MGIGADLGKNAGLSAVQEAHRAVDEAIPEAERAGAALLEQVHQALVELGGSLERAVGSIAITAGGLPDQLVEAIDGLTITITVARRHP